MKTNHCIYGIANKCKQKEYIEEYTQYNCGSNLGIAIIILLSMVIIRWDGYDGQLPTIVMYQMCCSLISLGINMLIKWLLYNNIL